MEEVFGGRRAPRGKDTAEEHGGGGTERRKDTAGKRQRERDSGKETAGKRQRERDSGKEIAGERQTKGHSGSSSRRDSGYTSRKKGITAEDTAAEGLFKDIAVKNTAEGLHRDVGGKVAGRRPNITESYGGGKTRRREHRSLEILVGPLSCDCMTSSSALS